MNNYNADYENDEPIVVRMSQVRSLFTSEVISKSFIFMFCALLITAFAACSVSEKTAIKLVLSDGYYILLLVEIGIVIASNIAIGKNIPILVAALYAVYSYVTGLTLSVIFLVYTESSVTSIFVVAAIVFVIMAVYGMVTDADLSTVGNICLMGLIGIIIAGFTNIVILRNEMFDTVINCIGVLIFVGLTAYDTQKIKERVENTTEEDVLIMSLYGGFELYLDFINLFLKLLRLFGKKRFSRD